MYLKLITTQNWALKAAGLSLKVKKKENIAKHVIHDIKAVTVLEKLLQVQQTRVKKKKPQSTQVFTALNIWSFY